MCLSSRARIAQSRREILLCDAKRFHEPIKAKKDCFWRKAFDGNMESEGAAAKVGGMFLQLGLPQIRGEASKKVAGLTIFLKGHGT